MNATKDILRDYALVDIDNPKNKALQGGNENANFHLVERPIVLSTNSQTPFPLLVKIGKDFVDTGLTVGGAGTPFLTVMREGVYKIDHDASAGLVIHMREVSAEQAQLYMEQLGGGTGGAGAGGGGGGTPPPAGPDEDAVKKLVADAMKADPHLEEAKVTELIEAAFKADPHPDVAQLIKDAMAADPHMDAAAVAKVVQMALAADPHPDVAKLIADAAALDPHHTDDEIKTLIADALAADPHKTDAEIDKRIADALAADPHPDVAKLIKDAAALDPHKTDADINKLIADAMALDPHPDVAKMIADALAADPHKTDADINKLIADALAASPHPDVAKIVADAMAADPHKTDAEITTIAKQEHKDTADEIVDTLDAGTKLEAVGDLEGIEHFRAIKPSADPAPVDPVVTESIDNGGMVALAGGALHEVTLVDNLGKTGAVLLMLKGTIQTAPKPNAAGVQDNVALEVYVGGDLAGAVEIFANGMSPTAGPVAIDLIAGKKVEYRLNGGDMIVFPGGTTEITAV